METFIATKDTLLTFLSSAVALWVVSELRTLRKSVELLNLNMAAYMERHTHSEKRTDKLEKRIENLEYRTFENG